MIMQRELKEQLKFMNSMWKTKIQKHTIGLPKAIFNHK